MTRTITLAAFALVALVALPAHAWIAPPAPMVTTRPNIYGGVTIDQGAGRPQLNTRPNIFGGYNVDGGRQHVTCTPNIFGGVSCH